MNTAPLAPPWLTELSKHLGEHESDPDLKAWLLSDGATVGDPQKFPWCADAMQTAIKNALPNEPFTGLVKQNPYYALNWITFGTACAIAYGAIAVFRRLPSGGHIGIVIGRDKKRNKLLIRGGNQRDSVSDTWISTDRLVGYRRPVTYGADLPPVPELDSSGGITSTKEV